MGGGRTARMLLLLAVLAVAAVAAAGCERGGGPKGQADGRGVPVPEAVTSIEVYSENDPLPFVRIEGEEQLENVLAGLAAAQPSGFGDPEFAGRLYRVEFRGPEGTMAYVLNDMRETDSLTESGKLYEAAGEEPGVWTVPSGWITGLLGAGDAPMLHTHLTGHSASAAVWANRRIRTASVPSSLEATMQFAGLAAGEEPPAYRIHWSDGQRFVVRFLDLRPGVSVRFRLDGLLSAEGERLVDSTQPSRSDVVLSGWPAQERLLWYDAQGRAVRSLSMRDRDADPQTNPDPIPRMAATAETDDGKAVLVYRADGGMMLVNMQTGAVRTLPAPEWGGAGAPFGNDYGVDVLYADRVIGDATYAVHGNRTLFRVRLAEGGSAGGAVAAEKLYESETPVKSVALSPDGSRVALLVGQEGALTAEADLLVLDAASGEPLQRVPRVTFGAHSDGFLFPLPMRWADERTVAVRQYGEPRGEVRIDAAGGERREAPGAALPEEVLRALSGQVGREPEVLRAYAEPEGGTRWLVQTPEGAWLASAGPGGSGADGGAFDSSAGGEASPGNATTPGGDGDAVPGREDVAGAVWLGPGVALGWSEDGKAAVWERGDGEEGIYFHLP